MQNSQIVQLIFVQLYRSFLKLLTSDELMVDNVTIKSSRRSNNGRNRKLNDKKKYQKI